ncbi:hypothetical protein GCM10007094_03280 [Pseudovibrio japonicus]|uniref:Uncharacterized protein n=1 Tax=Pseudovibrio japonicus TaxID=366534 RepID=A0ABQ3E0Y1_9HYPH|nr:hypothetical protein GCM10007094_03280 [Pseudovibrio japonicus]
MPPSSWKMQNKDVSMNFARFSRSRAQQQESWLALNTTPSPVFAVLMYQEQEAGSLARKADPLGE